MAHLYKEPKFCECGYSTRNRGTFSTHRSRHCPLRDQSTSSEVSDQDIHSRIRLLEQQLEVKDQQLAEQKEQKEQMREQLAEQKEQMREQVESLHEHMAEQMKAKDEQMKELLAAKDEQINELIKVAKKPRTVNNNTINNLNVDASVNSYGKESIDHITPAQIKQLLINPSTAVPELIRLKHKRGGGVNANVRCPNKKQAIYQVVAERAGEGSDDEPVKQWENRPKGDVLEDLYETNAGHLEAEADEDDYFGNRFLDHQDKVKASSEGEDGGKRYKEQLEKIHCVITS